MFFYSSLFLCDDLFVWHFEMNGKLLRHKTRHQINMVGKAKSGKINKEKTLEHLRFQLVFVV